MLDELLNRELRTVGGEARESIQNDVTPRRSTRHPIIGKAGVDTGTLAAGGDFFMYRFKPKYFPEYKSWCVVDSLKEDEMLFGDRLPSDEETCKQQARIANIAGRIVLDDLVKLIGDLVDKLKKY